MYSLITKEQSPKEFNEVFQTFWSCAEQLDADCYDRTFGFIIATNEKLEVIPLYTNSYYYVMLSNGNTYAAINNK